MAGKDELVDELMPDLGDIGGDDADDEEVPPTGDDPPAGDPPAEDPPADDPPDDETAEQKEVREQQARDKASGKFKPGKEKVAAPPKEPKAPAQAPQTVPLAVLLQERNATKAEMTALRAEIAKLTNPPKVETPPAIPDHATDPKGYTDAKLAEVLRKQAEFEEKQAAATKAATETAQQADQRTQESSFARQLEAAESNFVAQNPDYYEALEHVRTIRANQLRTLAPGITDQEIMQQIGREEIQLARNLAAQNRNPIATVYELAGQFGYRKTAAAEKLPEVKGGPKKLPPEQRLGTGGGDEDEAKTTNDEDYEDPFDQAFGELFKKKRA